MVQIPRHFDATEVSFSDPDPKLPAYFRLRRCQIAE
jgi:hypothetical protein